MGVKISLIAVFLIFLVLGFGFAIAFPIVPNPRPIPNQTINKTIIKEAIKDKISNSINISKIRIKIYDFKRYDNLIFVKVSLDNENYTHIFNLDKLPNRLKRYINIDNKSDILGWLRE